MTRYELQRGVMNVGVHGAGRHLLLIHGFPLDHTMWRNQINGLSDRYTVIAPDLRGFGESAISTEAIGMDQYAEDLAELLDKLHVKEPVAVCGLSMGGYIALEFATRYPERMGRLILCDTKAEADTDEAARQRIATAEEVLIKGTAGLAEGMIPRLFAQASLERRADAVEETRQVILNTSPVGVASALRGMAVRKDFTDQVADIECDTLLICGSDDDITPAAGMKQLAERFSRAEYVEIADAGHLSPLERPAEVNVAIRSVLW